MNAGRRFSNWLERVPAWQFAAAYTACMFVTVLIAGGLTQWVIKGHFDLVYPLGYSCIFAVATGAGATFARRRRRQRRHRSEKQSPSSEWWPWERR
jgi:hypothetical protein